MLTAAIDASAAQLAVSWLDNTNGMGTTRLERRLANDTAFQAVADVPPGTVAYVDSSVASATSYCYRAFAYDIDAISPYTDEVCATSTSDPLTVTVSKAGSGLGSVTSTPAGIQCGASCSATYPGGTLVTLTATPGASSSFGGWSGGGCSGTLACTLAGNTSVATTATFTAPVSSYALTVATTGPGAVTSMPAGINCGSDCTETYASGTQVILTARPGNNGAVFAGWSGGCTGSSMTCTVTMQAATSVAAAFKKKTGAKSTEIGEEVSTGSPELEPPVAGADDGPSGELVARRAGGDGR